MKRKMTWLQLVSMSRHLTKEEEKGPWWYGMSYDEKRKIRAFKCEEYCKDHLNEYKESLENTLKKGFKMKGSTFAADKKDCTICNWQRRELHNSRTKRK